MTNTATVGCYVFCAVVNFGRAVVNLLTRRWEGYAVPIRNVFNRATGWDRMDSDHTRISFIPLQDHTEKFRETPIVEVPERDSTFNSCFLAIPRTFGGVPK